MEMSEIPNGWINIRLGEIVKLKNGFAFPSQDFKKLGVPVIRQTNLNGAQVTLEKTVYVDDRYLRNKKEFIVSKGDLLMGMSGSIGKICEYNLDEKALQNQRVGKLNIIHDNIINKRYLYYFANTVETQLIEKGKGLGVLNVSGKDIESLELFLPPINEQKRIVEKLDKLLVKVNAAKARLDKIPQTLKRFRQSVFSVAVSGELTKGWREKNGIDDKWEKVILKDVAELRLGKMLDKSKNLGDKTKYLGNINVRWFSFDLENLAELRITKKEKEVLSIKDGDLLICEGGEPGRCAIWNSGMTDITFQKAIHRVRLDDYVNPYWVAFNIKNDADNQKLEEYFTGTTIRHLTGQSLKTYTFELPGLEEQKEIVRRVEQLFKFADQIEARCTKAKQYVDKLTQSILAKAFRGELVPQDPNDEPAEKLLQRISEQKTKGAGNISVIKKNAYKKIERNNTKRVNGK